MWWRTPSTVLGLIGSAVAVVLVVQSWRRAHRPEGYDLTAYLDAASKVWSGEVPYDAAATFPYLYPPAFAWLMQPLAAMPYGMAVLLWTFGSLLALCYAARWCQQRVRDSGREVPARATPWLTLALAIPFFRIVHSNLTNGQVNLLLVGACVLFAEALRRERPGRAGFWLALAITTKLTPGILVLLLVARGAWKALAWTAVWGVVLWSAPALTLGIDTTIDFTRAFFEDIVVGRGGAVRSYTLGADQETREFFSLHGLAGWLVEDWQTSKLVRNACAALVAGGLVAAIGWLRRSTQEAAQGVRDLALTTGLALCLVGERLVAPMSEKHHLATALPAVALAVFSLPALPSRRIGVGLLVALTACALLSKPFPEAPFYFGFVALALAMAWWSRPRAAEFTPVVSD